MPLAPLILVVDDFDDGREMYAEILAFAGLRVQQAPSGERALEVIAADPPAVIVLDLSLPGMDGWEVLRRLRSRNETQQVPVVVLSGYGTPADRVRAQEMGCAAYLLKPCLPGDLVREVMARIAR